MKTIILILLLGISLSYDAGAALNYAKRHCCKSCYNKNYNNYRNVGGDCANFVSQCLTAGGLSLAGCSGKDNKGMLPNVGDLITCLKKKGWSKNSKKFRSGYPFVLRDHSHAMLAGPISNGYISIYGHTNNRCGDAKIKLSTVETYSP